MSKNEISSKEYEELYEKLIENSFETIVIHRNNEILFVNSLGVDLLGATNKGQIIGKSLLNFIHHEFHSAKKKRIQMIELQNKQVDRVEEKLFRLDGKVIDIEIISMPVTLKGIPAIQSLILNISDRKSEENKRIERENQLYTLINSIPDFVCFKDGEGRWLEVNQYGLTLFNLNNIDYQGKTNFQLAILNPISKKAFHYCLESDNKAWEYGETIRCEEIIPQPSEENRILDMIKVPLFYPDGERKGLVIIGRDITKQKKEEELRHKYNERYRLIANNVSDLIVIVNKDGIVEYASPSHLHTLGVAPENVEGISAFSLLHHDDVSYIQQQFLEIIKIKKEKKVEYRLNHRDKGWLIFEGKGVPLIERNGNVNKVIIVTRDITERKQFEEKNKYLAYHDTLTRLPNRNKLNDELKKAILQTNKYKKKMAVMFLDLDGFKKVNDTKGHSIGDLLLKQVASRMEHLSLKKGSVFRYGGDEFIIILENTNEEKVSKLAKQLIEEISKPYDIKGFDLYISLSIGIAFYSNDLDDLKDDNETLEIKAETLIQRADITMYAVKNSGKGEFQFYKSKYSEKLQRKMTIENELPKAINRDEFFLLYQPKINLNTGEVVGVEALIRWQHPNLGCISPGEFIPIAEKTGLIVPIGKMVLQKACEQNKEWQEKGFHPISISVNISSVQIKNDNLESTVAEVLKETKLEPKYLELEVTESVMQHGYESISTLNKLKALGIKISIGDFGTGYSPLSYLRKLPVDILKIDKTFVDDINKNKDGETIISIIINMGHSLQYTLIAEGIENINQMTFLKQKGCQIGQGYYFNKPLDCLEVEERLFEEK